jgi:hypothetical protein
MRAFTVSTSPRKLQVLCWLVPGMIWVPGRDQARPVRSVRHSYLRLPRDRNREVMTLPIGPASGEIEITACCHGGPE